MMMMMMWGEEFWRENINIDGDGDGWTWRWTWTLAVILLIFSCRMLSSRFRYFYGGSTLSSSSSATITPKTDNDIPSLRPGIISDLDLKNLMNELDDTSPDIIWKTSSTRVPIIFPTRPSATNPRMQWDKTMVHHQQLQVDRGSGIEIGRTIKKFPFLTPREYVLAWKLWQGMDGSFYCFSKECEHPLAPRDKRYIRVAVLRSGWRIRKGLSDQWAVIVEFFHGVVDVVESRFQPRFKSFLFSAVKKLHPLAAKYDIDFSHNFVENVTLTIRKVAVGLGMVTFVLLNCMDALIDFSAITYSCKAFPGRNACEIRMVHQEDAGLNIEMAKLAFAKGIWSYVCKMGVALRKYSDEKHHQLNSTAGASMYIQKVPPEFEVTKDMISTAHPENLITTVPPHIGIADPTRGNSLEGLQINSSQIVWFSWVVLSAFLEGIQAWVPSSAAASANGKFNMAVNIDVDLCMDLTIAPYLRSWKDLEDFLEEIIACAF
ncbi:UNVERIFIED_CONTAM: hypothetical protein Sangu_2602100 [Sesamum angustifolium]|uniref:START domain-containing protein n=1 Tax=Sesamum angustifolium TaxID=2727405 RepID=A0AAW2J601_9LAMI